MALLQVIHVDHERQPGLTRGRFGGTTLILQPGKVLRFKAPYPPIDCGTRDVQEPTDTPLAPALSIELQDFEASVSVIGMAMIGPKRQLALHGTGTVLPEF